MGCGLYTGPAYTHANSVFYLVCVVGMLEYQLTLKLCRSIRKVKVMKIWTTLLPLFDVMVLESKVRLSHYLFLE